MHEFVSVRKREQIIKPRKNMFLNDTLSSNTKKIKEDGSLFSGITSENSKKPKSVKDLKRLASFSCKPTVKYTIQKEFQTNVAKRGGRLWVCFLHRIIYMIYSSV